MTVAASAHHHRHEVCNYQEQVAVVAAADDIARSPLTLVVAHAYNHHNVEYCCQE